MAQRQQREPSDEWEIVAANEVHTVDALKQEGNALFQQRRFLDAIQVYARALAQLPPTDATHLTGEDIESLVNLEIAVRLNRALAYIELDDANLLAYAEEDCTIALARQPHCVKAFYRRALARERLGKIKDALSDVERMHALEPANPAGLQLMARLQEAWSIAGVRHEPVESELSAALKQQCSLSKPPPPQMLPRASGDESTAHDVWKALQEDEQRLRDQVFKQAGATKSCASTVAHNKGRAKACRTDGVRPTGSTGDEVRTKTDSLWAALMDEETSTVERIYKKRTGTTTYNSTSGKLKTTSVASIHPSR